MSLFDALVRVKDATDVSPVILHAPHGGRVVSDRFRAAFVISDAALEREHDALVDHFTDRIADAAVSGGPVASSVVNGLSRFVVDVERFDDESEEKNTVGQGVRYTHGAWRDRIRDSRAEDIAPLGTFYADYAAEVERLTDAALARHGRAVIIDIHSYNARPLPHELHADERRPELCVGFEEFHASPDLRDAVDHAFAGIDRVANEPFHGSYVPLKHYRRDARVQSVMLEIRRDVYMDEVAVVADGGFPRRIG